MTLPPSEYRAYIRSPAWRARRAKWFAKHERVCLGCGSTDRLHLHHHTYARLGAEQDGDLVCVCDGCHQLIHRHHERSGLGLTTATFAVLGLAARYGRRGLAQRLRRLPVPELNRGHVPVNRRGGRMDGAGRARSSTDWRHEARPAWASSPAGRAAERRRDGL